MWILMVYKPTYNWGSENPLVLSAADIRSCPTSCGALPEAVFKSDVGAFVEGNMLPSGKLSLSY